MKRILTAVVMVIALTAMAAPPCWACSCVPATKKELAKSADVIFTGRVLEVIEPPADDTFGDDNIKVRFRVKKVYKGSPKEITYVYTNESGSMCGVGFEENETYTVFADWDHDKKFVHSCSGTKQGGINPDNYGLGEAYAPKE